MRTKFVLTLEEAEAVLKAARHHAAAGDWAVSIAVVDDAGMPIALARMDKAPAISASTAIEKARSAGMIGVSTKILEDMVAARPALVTMAGRTAVEGGIPILHHGQSVGGIGVSGVTSAQDAEVARAGLSALPEF